MAADLELAIGAPESGDVHRVTTLPVVVLNVHSSCNCRCVMCDIWKTSESRALRPADLQPLLSSMRSLGVRWIVFTGGEPLLNRALPQLCGLLRRGNIRLTLLTTGLLLERYANEVADSFDDIVISLDGPEPVHDKIRRVPGGFRIIARGLQALGKLRPQFRITARTTVQKDNFRHLRETVRAAHSLDFYGISFLAVDLISQAFNRSLVWPVERQDQVGLSLAEIGQLETEIRRLIHEHSSEIRSGFIAEPAEKLWRIARHFRSHLGLEEPQAPHCNAPWKSAVVDVDGTVRPCFFHQPIGSLRTQNLAEAINSEAALQFRAHLNVASNPVCKRCVCSLNYRL